MPAIYIIEDIAGMDNLVAMYLAKAGMTPVVFGSAEAALEALQGTGGFDTIFVQGSSAGSGKNHSTTGQPPHSRCNTPDLIILDLNLPGMSGFDFLKCVAEKHLTAAPVIILSARDADEDIIEGLGLGADEFVTKPFSPKVLVARVMSHLRRQAAMGEHGDREDAVHFGDYTLLLDSCVLKKGSTKVPLSNKEYAVLECLVRHNDEAMTPEKIYKEVWGTQYGDITAVAVYVKRLRQKIESDPISPVFIQTVYGKGYMFSAGGKA